MPWPMNYFLARDGGFIRAGYHAELDELVALRDESRKLIAQCRPNMKTRAARPEDQTQQRPWLFHRAACEAGGGPSSRGG